MKWESVCAICVCAKASVHKLGKPLLCRHTQKCTQRQHCGPMHAPYCVALPRVHICSLWNGIVYMSECFHRIHFHLIHLASQRLHYFLSIYNATQRTYRWKTRMFQPTANRMCKSRHVLCDMFALYSRSCRMPRCANAVHAAVCIHSYSFALKTVCWFRKFFSSHFPLLFNDIELHSIRFADTTLFFLGLSERTTRGSHPLSCVHRAVRTFRLFRNVRYHCVWMPSLCRSPFATRKRVHTIFFSQISQLKMESTCEKNSETPSNAQTDAGPQDTRRIYLSTFRDNKIKYRCHSAAAYFRCGECCFFFAALFLWTANGLWPDERMRGVSVAECCY